MTSTLTTTQTTEVKLVPALKRKLLLKLRAYEELVAQAHAIKSAQTKIKGEVETLFIDADEFAALQDGAAVGDYKLKYVSPVRSSLDKKRLLAQGVTMAQIEFATVSRPTKPYVKITVPGADEDEE